MGVVGLIGLAVDFAVPRLAAVDGVDLGSLLGVLHAVLGFLGGTLLSAVFGSIVGALIIGSRAALRSRPQRSAGESSDRN